ncbi:MAG TPA: amidohydrolase family protein [Stellaceae bacterium]|jgi:predicted TIM-barrel fold metal-dependent hydrolase|nr:amidohydrolase family protein [Stellaceae bacterium]
MPRATPLFDAHCHIIDPRFPLVENQGYLPPAFTVDDYLAQAAPLGITGGAVVSGSFQEFDQDYLLDALARLGPSYVGVTQCPATTPDDTILDLARRGVRAVRFNLRRGGSEGIEALETMAQRVHDLAAWHVELYADAAGLAPLMPHLRRLPRLVIDHLGLSEEGLPTLLKLVEHGVTVKATGFGRVVLDVPAALAAIVAIDPARLIFGTDMPSTRAQRPFAASDIDLVVETLGPDIARRVLHDNAVALYRPLDAGV